MGYAIAAKQNDITLADWAACCDAFYIGGTKLGALLGKAVVIPNEKIQKDFRYFIKQKGAMLAKGRVLGIQFLALQEDGLYFDLAAHANAQALRLRRACEEAGLQVRYDSSTNQQFVVFPNALLKHLEETYAFAHIQPLEHEQTLIRLCTSWATRPEDVDQFIQDLNRLTE